MTCDARTAPWPRRTPGSGEHDARVKSGLPGNGWGIPTVTAATFGRCTSESGRSEIGAHPHVEGVCIPENAADVHNARPGPTTRTQSTSAESTPIVALETMPNTGSVAKIPPFLDHVVGTEVACEPLVCPAGPSAYCSLHEKNQLGYNDVRTALSSARDAPRRERSCKHEYVGLSIGRFILGR